MKSSIIAIALVGAFLSGCGTTEPEVRIEYVRPKAPKSIVVPCQRKPRPTEAWDKNQLPIMRHMNRLDASDSDCRTKSDAKDKWLIDNDLVEK